MPPPVTTLHSDNNAAAITGRQQQQRVTDVGIARPTSTYTVVAGDNF
jgi:hypothetical protein